MTTNTGGFLKCALLWIGTALLSLPRAFAGEATFELKDRLLLARTPPVEQLLVQPPECISRERLIELGALAQADWFCSQKKCGDAPCRSAREIKLEEKIAPRSKAYYFTPALSGGDEKAEKREVECREEKKTFLSAVVCTSEQIVRFTDQERTILDPNLFCAEATQSLESPSQCGARGRRPRCQEWTQSVQSWFPSGATARRMVDSFNRARENTFLDWAKGSEQVQPMPGSFGFYPHPPQAAAQQKPDQTQPTTGWVSGATRQIGAAAGFATSAFVGALQIPVLAQGMAHGLHYGGKFFRYWATDLYDLSPDTLYQRATGENPELADRHIEEHYRRMMEQINQREALLTPAQRGFIRKFKKKFDENLAIRKKSKLDSLWVPGRYREIERAAILKDRVKLRLSDLDSETLKQWHSLQEIEKLFGEDRTSPSEPSRQKKLTACQRELDAQAGFKEWLIERATSMVPLVSQGSSSHEQPKAPSKAWYLFSEPGTLKTSGLQALMNCDGIPVCTISHSKLSEEVGKMAVPNYSAALKKLVAECLRTDLMDEGNGKFVKNSMILFDDFDQILNGPLNPDHFESHNRSGAQHPMGMGMGMSLTANLEPNKIRTQREEFFRTLKDLADPAQSMTDPSTEFPVDLSRMNFFMTGNSVPKELGSKSGSPIGSRWSMYSVPYPDDAYRKHIGQKTWAALVSQHSVHRLDENCENKLQEIISYDQTMAADRKGRLGVRSLYKFMDTFKSYVDLKSKESGGKISCERFNVADQAKAFQEEYKSRPNESLLAYDFSSEVFVATEGLKEKVADLTQEAQKKILKLQESALNESLPYNVRKSNLEAILSSLSFARQPPPDQEVVTRKFNQSIRPLFSGDHDQDLRPWQILASAALRKATDPNLKNRPFLIQAGPGAELTLIERLAEALDAPTAFYSGADAFREYRPAWMQYQQIGGQVNFSGGSILMLVDRIGPANISFDRSKKVWIAESTDGEKVGLYKQCPITGGIPPQPDQIITREEFERSPQVEHLWLQETFKHWGAQKASNAARGFVVLEIEDPTHLSSLRSLSQDSGYQSPDSIQGDQAVRDLRRLNILIKPKITSANQDDWTHFFETATKDRDLETVRLPGVREPEIPNWSVRKAKLFWEELKKENRSLHLDWTTTIEEGIKQCADLILRAPNEEPTPESASQQTRRGSITHSSDAETGSEAEEGSTRRSGKYDKKPTSKKDEPRKPTSEEIYDRKIAKIELGISEILNWKARQALNIFNTSQDSTIPVESILQEARLLPAPRTPETSAH